MDLAHRGMNDFRIVMLRGSPFIPAYALAKHERTVEYLKANVQAGDVVVTHHAPSEQSIDKKLYDENSLNYAYFSNLEELILDLQPSVWVHGHMHHRNNYKIGETCVISNPRGYVNYERYSEEFTTDHYFELEDKEIENV